MVLVLLAGIATMMIAIEVHPIKREDCLFHGREIRNEGFFGCCIRKVLAGLSIRTQARQLVR